MDPVLHVPAFEDNYIWLIRSRRPAPDNRHVAIVDPGDADPVLETLAREHLVPAAILCTHHHQDHVGGVTDILQHFPVPVYGPKAGRIPGLSHPVKDGDIIHILNMDISLQVLEVPGHTAGHVAYYGHDLLFCGDTLFSAGCGRLFEGTAEQMHTSLSRLAALPENTAVYCAHEYTRSNLRFAQAVEPDNRDTQTFLDQVTAQRAARLPTIPSRIGLEKKINPFLRVTTDSVRIATEKQSGIPLEDPVQVFAALRRWKDNFK
jgi:hydroxyacylglutathione hydrolase